MAAKGACRPRSAFPMSAGRADGHKPDYCQGDSIMPDTKVYLLDGGSLVLDGLSRLLESRARAGRSDFPSIPS